MSRPFTKIPTNILHTHRPRETRRMTVVLHQRLPHRKSSFWPKPMGARYPITLMEGDEWEHAEFVVPKDNREDRDTRHHPLKFVNGFMDRGAVGSPGLEECYVQEDDG